MSSPRIGQEIGASEASRFTGIRSGARLAGRRIAGCVGLWLLPVLSVGCDPQGDVVATAIDLCRVGTLGYGGPYGSSRFLTGWLERGTAQGAASLGASVLTATLLAPYEVIVVHDVREGSPGQAGVDLGLGRAYSPDEVEVLRQWVAQGGGLMTLTGYGDPSEITNVNRLLAPHSLSYGATRILAGDGTSSSPVTHWADHPLARGVTRVGVDNAHPVQGGGTLIAWEPSKGRYDLARAAESGNGHVFAWGDEWVAYDSELTQRSDYQVAQFWFNALSWLGQTSQCRVAMPSPR